MYNKKQRIAALIGIIFLIALYIATLVFSILDFEGSERLFQACLFGTIAIPILLWIYIWLFGKMTNKKTLADFNTDSPSDLDSSTDPDAITISKRKKKENKRNPK